ncbi:Ig-like domain-containing protein [Moraxella bovis]|uniref:Ig-like domain-containing protein n=1 Tax=Moraxella bovis TaxID=476 RepID=UPI002226C503|nr:Calx-beta domain-containing protein [Moraxella bovis]
MVPVTAKNVTIKVHSHVEQIKELTLATHDGQPDVIKADKNVNYEFFDHSIGRAPNHIIAKRKGKDLHVSFEREGQNDDLIIEGFFEDEDKALIGVAEDGHYYYYIPDTGEVADYVTQLQDADVEGQALGGEHHLTPLWLMLPTGTFPWWPLLGLGVIPFLGKDDDDKPAPTPDSVISTTNDSERGDGDNPVRVNVLKNDADNAVPETLRLIDPETGRPTTEKVVVSGQGTWELDPKEPGVVIFTPEKGYNGNPTPINYVVKNKEGKESQPTPVFIIYDASTTPDTKPGTPGQPVTQNVTNNDGDVDPSTVKLVDPNNPNNPPSNEVKVPGQGTWTVGPKPGEVTFTPEDGFTGDPDPIKYVVKDKGGNDLPPTDVDVSYPQLTNPDTKPGTPGQPVTQNVTNNDGDVDPSTVKLVDPNNPNNPPSNEVKVPGQGTWTVGPKPGEVTFTPEDGFTGDPDPIKYVVKDKDGKDLPPTSVDVTYPEPTQPTPTNPDTKPGTPGQPVTQNVTNNDGDVDPSTVKLVDPNNPNNPPSNEVKVPGQGTWTVGPKPGEVTFTPEDGFTGDPDPIKYVVKDKGGNDLPPTDVDVSYPQLTNPDTKPGTPGQPVTQNVTNNDGDVDPSTVKLVDPKTGEPTDKIVVPNEGTWTVGPNPGEVTFTPEDGLTGNPGPVNYYINDKSGNQLQPTPVAVTYPSKPVADVKKGEIGQPVPQKVTDNDENVDPSTVRLVDPVSKEPVPVGTPIKVPGQGTWTQDPNDPSVVIFTPNPGFEQSPTPINYIVKGKSGLDLKPTPVAVTYPTITTPDTKPGTPGQPVTQNVTNNDGDVDPSTVKLVDPNNPNNPPSNEVKVPGQGTWTVGPKPGEVTFTPEDGFTGDPDPIKYVVKDKDGKDLPPTSVDVTYPPGDPANPNPIATTPDSKSGYRGEPVTQNVTGNDNNVKPDTVKLVDPITGHPTDKIVVPNEGTWTVGPNPGEVTFTPVPELGDKDPSPINYIVENDKEPGTFSKPTPVNITYPEIVKPKVSITGLTNVNEAVGEIEYTISLDKPAKEDITVTYVTKAGASTNPAEVADLKDGFVTKTVVIKAGETSATVKVGIVNDNEYEVAEDYNIAITKVEGNASIDAAKDNVTTTIHDDGKGTPDGRDPNNPDNINPNVPSDPAKPPFNPADPDNPDNNPDPRLPPTNPVPDADNDGPAKVSITGLTNVNEAVSEVEYTISLDKPAKENITVTYVTKAGTSTNPAEAADLKDGFVTKTVVIKAGETSATVKVGIVNDNEYEVAEDYNIAITKVEGNASIDAAKDNVTTTIHDDGKGTPDGRDPNNPDNINPNVPSDPAKPPFNPADPDNPDNNPDPRLPPTNPVPDADNDKPTVNLSGVRTVLESAGTAKYTFTLANGKTADKDVVIEYQVTVPANAAGINLAEAADFGNGTFGVTKTAIIKVGTSSVDINVPIINDEVYEGIETFVVNMTRVSDNASKGVDTVTTTINDFNGEVGVNKDKPVIKLDPPAHVSEEGLPGGNKDNDPVGVDKTNATTSDGEIRITSIDTSLSKNVTLALTKPTTIVTSGKQPVTWTTPDEGLTWIGRTPDDKPVLTIKLKEQIVKEGNTIAYKYTTELHAPIDHTEGDNKEDNLEVNFGIVVKDGKTEIARDNKIVTRVEDDSPVSGVSIHNIDVPVDDVRLMDIVTGFSNPDSSNETDKRYFVSTNNDKDVYAETIQWGNPSRNVQPRASYGIAEDVSMINKKLDGFNIPFSLGTFNHDNQGIYVNKGLESVNMHVDFVVSINGEKQTVKTIFDLKHIETPNKDYDNNDLLDNLIYGITPDDFVIFKPQETTLLIGGKRYTLKLNQPEKVSGNGELRDSVDNYDLLVKMEENYNTRGGSDDIRGVNSLYNTGAANLIKTQLDGITREDVVSGKVVIINTKEKANNGFKLSATLIPLDPNPDANNDLEHATNFRTGGDVVSDARLLDPNAQKVIWTLKDITDANKNIVDSDNNPSTFTFKTKYGTFIGNINGSYEFRGADNLAEVVDLGVEDRLVFGYTYQDNDGDSIQDTVVINFNDYAKETTGRTVNGTDDHDYIIGTTAAAADIIYGGKGDDTLIGELGADKLYGGEGNDKIVYDADDLVIDGGAGIDTLLLVSKPYKVGDEVKLDGNIDLTNTIATGFEVLDMNNGTAQNLTITAKDVLSINPEGRSLDVLGDGLDTVTLDGTFTKIDESTSEVKVGFDQYISNNGATLFISEEIKNIIM